MQWLLFQPKASHTEGLVKEVRKPAKSAPAQAKRKAIDLNELAEIKAQIVDAKEYEPQCPPSSLLHSLCIFWYS